MRIAGIDRVSGGPSGRRFPLIPKHAKDKGTPMATRTYGTVSPERRMAMTGLEFVQGIASGELPLNTIAQTLGYDVVEAERGRVAITLDPTGAHLNPGGTVHGGLTATLLDSCM